MKALALALFWPAMILSAAESSPWKIDPQPQGGPSQSSDSSTTPGQPPIAGCCWQGTLHSELKSTFRVGSGGSCTGEAWDHNLSLVVGHDGTTVNGKAVGHLVSPPQCSFAVHGTQARNKSGDVSGRFNGRQFELQIYMTSNDGMTFGADTLVNRPGLAPKTLVVPITGPGIAQGETVTTRTDATVVGTGRQTVTLKRNDDPKYRMTREAVIQAILKACRERHITLPSIWQQEVQAGGGGGGFVRNLNDDPSGGDALGFVIPPEQHSDIWIIGKASAPCMGSDDGSIIVSLMIWSTHVVDGKRSMYGMIEEVKGSGDVSQKGLDDAMRKAFDAAKLDKYKSSGPPS